MNARRTPLRIALNHTRFAPSGGVEGYLRHLTRYLLEHGHSVDFFAARFSLALEHPRLRLVRVPLVRSPRPLRVASFAYWSERCIRREERERPYDVVQGFSRTYHHNLYRDGSGCWQDYCELYLRRVNRRGLRRLYYRFNPIDWLVKRIERRRYVERRPRLVVAISRLVEEQIERRYGVPRETLRVVYSGVDCAGIHPGLRASGRQKLSAAFGAPLGERERVLVFVGNDFRRKGLDVVLDTLAAHEHPPYRLTVVGGDRRIARYEARAIDLGLGERVRFLGSRDDVPELLAGADVLLLPSYFDAFGNIVGEALAAGTPAIVSARAGASEWIDSGVNGWVAEETDVASFAACLARFFAQRDLAPMRRAARATAESHGWDEHFAEIESMYYEVAGSRAGLER